MSDQGFILLQLSKGVKLEDSGDRAHERIHSNLLTGTLIGTIEVLTPLHVGTGDDVLTETIQPTPANAEIARLVAPFFRLGGQINVPGSTLKGVFRHLYEMVTPSCLAQHDSQVRPESSLQACRYSFNPRNPQNPIKMCPACRVFGGLGYEGNVRFHPALPTGPVQTEIRQVPARWEPGIDPKVRKLYIHGTSDADPYEPVELLPSGSTLQFKMDFGNLKTAELGLILMVMGQDAVAPIYPKVGGIKAHGYGAVQIRVNEITLISAESYLQYELTKHSMIDRVPQYVREAQTANDLLINDHWNTLTKYLGKRPEAF